MLHLLESCILVLKIKYNFETMQAEKEVVSKSYNVYKVEQNFFKIFLMHRP